MIIIIMIIVVLIFLAILFNNPNIGTNNPDIQAKANSINYLKNYEKKDYLLSQNEIKFYKLLKSITDRLGLSLFSQVSLYQIVKSKNQSAFNRIRSKSIDFVITNSNSNIKLCIELDDSTHQRYDRVQRDKFLNELFKNLNIEIIRVPVQNFYNLDELEAQIKKICYNNTTNYF